MVASLIRHRGLDLPVFDPGTPIAYGSKKDLGLGAAFAISNKEGTFVRGTLLSVLLNGTNKIISLEEALRVADEGFAEVAAGCGAIVIKHTWGLYNFKGDSGSDAAISGAKALGRHQNYLPDKELIPANHILVAEVEAIKPLEGESELLAANPAQRRSIIASSQAYDKPRESRGEAYWVDSRPEQFANGISLEQGQGLILLDIEPKLAI